MLGARFWVAVAVMVAAATGQPPSGEVREDTGALLASGLPWAHSCRADDSSCALLGDDNERFFADRLVKGALAILADPECQEGFSLDASAPTFRVEDAARVFRKCRVLVLRNAMDRAQMEHFRDHLARHIGNIKTGATSLRGETTHGEDYFVFPLGNIGEDSVHKRWLMLLPQEFAAPEIVAPPFLTKLLSHPRILDSDFVLNDGGVAISEPGSRAQVWHKDDDYLFGEESLAVNGMAGHDFGSFSVTVMHPLLDVTEKHGPTEFCMGSSMLSGYDYDKKDEDDDIVKALRDPSLMDVLWRHLPDPLDQEQPSCFRRSPENPLGARRVETLNLTDVVLFDYQVRHRGGPNDSDDLRSLLYLTYARRWYNDHNFQARNKQTQTKDVEFRVGGGFETLSKERRKNFARIIATARFAKTEPGPAAGAPGDGAPPPALEDIVRPFAYDPSSTNAEEYYERWRASFSPDDTNKPPKAAPPGEL